ncbi:MAG: hypothetical protein NT031_01695, partial [Planctomycetota bacterium]|nr:hypothetical protein [Planctomycetota bacterium]
MPLDGGFEDVVDDDGVVSPRFVDAQLAGLGADGGQVGHRSAGVLVAQIGVLRPPPRAGVVDEDLPVGQNDPPGPALSGGLE